MLPRPSPSGRTGNRRGLHLDRRNHPASSDPKSSGMQSICRARMAGKSHLEAERSRSAWSAMRPTGTPKCCGSRDGPSCHTSTRGPRRSKGRPRAVHSLGRPPRPARRPRRPRHSRRRSDRHVRRRRDSSDSPRWTSRRSARRATRQASHRRERASPNAAYMCDPESSRVSPPTTQSNVARCPRETCSCDSRLHRSGAASCDGRRVAGRVHDGRRSSRRRHDERRVDHSLDVLLLLR